MAIFDDLRAAWNARPANGATAFVPASERREFFSHYDGSAPLNLANQPHSACLARVRQDQAFHMNSNGWSDIGYNGLVCQHGRLIEGRGIDKIGAHCPDHNRSGYGFQFMVGGDESPTAAAYARMRRAYDDCSKRSGRTLAKKGHRDGYATACPGDRIYAWVRAGMGSPTPTPIPTPAKEWDDMASKDDIKAAIREVLKEDGLVPSPFIASNPSVAPVTALSYAMQWALQARNRAVDAAAIASAVAGAVNPNIDVDALAKAIVLELGKD